jgi:hypothetical protein
MLHEYSKQKENLLAIYAMLEENNLNFVNQDLKVKLLEKKNSLTNDQFILAIAGQMKAGKSTLLNALIFGDDILPADDTELTAKITFITYGEEPCYEATLYSKSEFEDLRNSMRGTDSDGDFNKLLNDSLEKLQDRGFSSYDELLSKKVIEGTNLKELIDFVGKKGIFTPFVNSLTLKINSDWVKNIIVVDTPGMNSPNQLRDKVVKDWIVKADAVLYCSFAGRALDATDLKFIQDYMLHISSKHRLFAMTKADVITGEDKLMNTIGDLIDSDWNKKLDLIPSRDAVFPVCQMAVLLDKMNKGNVLFTDKMEGEYELYEKRVDFDRFNKQFLKLETAIEKKLIANKDSNIIETHQQYLTTIFDKRLQDFIEDIDSFKKSFELLDSSEVELKKKKQQINNDIKNLTSNLIEIERGIKNHFDDSLKYIPIKEDLRKTIEVITKRLDGMTLDDLGRHAPSIVDEKLSDTIYSLKEKTIVFADIISKGFQRIFDKKELKLEYLSSDILKGRFELECRSFINLKIRELESELVEASNSLKKNYSDNISDWSKFWGFINNDAKAKNRGKEALNGFISETLNPQIVKFGVMEATLVTDLRLSVTEIFKQIEEDSRKKLDLKNEEIMLLDRKEGKDIERSKQETLLKLEVVKSKKVELENLRNEIVNKINS